MYIIHLTFIVLSVQTFIGCSVGQVSENQVYRAVNPLDGQYYVWVPAGSFDMGCSPDDMACQEMKPFANEKPCHRVVISKGFWIGETEITIQAYRRYAQATKSKSPEELVLAAPERYRNNSFPQSEDHPIAYVTWEDAMLYCIWAGGRLPTEAEWEYAARAGNTSSMYGTLDDIAWYADNSGRLRLNSSQLQDSQLRKLRLKENHNNTHPVGKKAPNDFGLYDMLGNVSEYCLDRYEATYYEHSDKIDPTGPSSGKFRVIRGGEYWSRPLAVRVSRRTFMYSDHRFNSIGFRCVLEKMPDLSERPQQ